MSETIYVAGHTGMVGSALCRAIESSGRGELLTATRQQVDLTEQAEVRSFIAEHRPDAIIVAAARVGGIHANEAFPAEFIQQNLAIASNVVDAAWRAGVPRLLFLGSSCIYPKFAEQPMSEDALLTGPLEPTNEAYAIAKIAGLKLCQFYRKQYGVLYHSAMPTNLYGPADNYHPENSHVIPGMIRRFHEARQAGAEAVTIWGTGTPLREFLHVDDLASACLHLLSLADPPDWVNVGSGEEISTADLATLVAEVVGFEGEIHRDLTRPDGTPRKLMDSTRLRATGWRPRYSLRDGLEQTWRSFLEEQQSGLRAV